MKHFLHGRTLLGTARGAIPPKSAQDVRAGEAMLKMKRVGQSLQGFIGSCVEWGTLEGLCRGEQGLEQWCCSKSCLVMCMESCLETIRMMQMADSALE